MLKLRVYFIVFVCCISSLSLPAQQKQANVWWHGQERLVHYLPEGEDFLLVNGTKRFNRSLYAANTAFRVEAGDLPEFALNLPGMGGNLKLGVISGNAGKWLTEAKVLRARYRPGSMLYDIKDPLLGNGTLHLSVLALSQGEGVIVKINAENVAPNVLLFAAFGGATGQKPGKDADIDMNPEPYFSLSPAACRGNAYTIKKNTFKLSFGTIGNLWQLAGVFPSGTKLKLADAGRQASPQALYSSLAGVTPLVCGTTTVRNGKAVYMLIQNAAGHKVPSASKLHDVFDRAEKARQALTQRVRLSTPDPYINTLGGALSVAADALWDEPSFLQGDVGQSAKLPGWEGPYMADPLGWHDRAVMHFRAYAKTQLAEPASGPVVPDTALHLARQAEKAGSALFSRGYIGGLTDNNGGSKLYNMNPVYIDQLLKHLEWTGDIAFAKEIWPVITRHLEREKRNFDRDGDGLYDAYAAVRMSDGLYYSGGGVTYSSAYSYRANLLAAKIASLIGENPVPYAQEAARIFNAVNSKLWLPEKGWYGEYQDLSGEKMIHPYAGLWTVCNSVDSKIADPFKAFQVTNYVDTYIPHIPVKATGLDAADLAVIATSNWQPYTWSVNNVSLPDILYTSLTYWKSSRPEEAFNLWKSGLVESMYLSSSPANFEQLSFYDAQRGELNRDFSDAIGMTARSLVEGLFGIAPDALSDTLTIRPGLPASWDHASLKIPDVAFDYKRNTDREIYTIVPSFKRNMNLKLLLPARSVAVRSVRLNGQPADWKSSADAFGNPEIRIDAAKAKSYTVEILWEGIVPDKPKVRKAVTGAPFNVVFSLAHIERYSDPEHVLSGVRIVDGNSLNVDRLTGKGTAVIFIKVRQRDFSWWQPVSLSIKPEVEISFQEQSAAGLRFSVTNNEGIVKRGTVRVNPGVRDYSQSLEINPGETREFIVPAAYVLSGTNRIHVEYGRGNVSDTSIINWNIRAAGSWQKVDLQRFYNDKVTSIFKNKYLSPRPSSPTLQLPWQGVGNWNNPLVDPLIDDSGFRRMAYGRGQVVLPNGVPMGTTATPTANNVVFTSKWDNYPDSVTVPLSGRASHAYFLMAGSTNPMQSRLDNGEIIVYYTDGTSDRLPLRNPENWWPIEQDYYTDGYAFTTGAPMPYRVYLRSGMAGRNNINYTTIKGFTNRAIDGGAATVLDLPLDPGKELKEMRLKTLANDVVIGLMSITLQR